MNVARKEMALVLATVYHKFLLHRGQAALTTELYNTQRARDIDPSSDYIIPVPTQGSRGLQVVFRH